jgi:hypothetical protein
MRRHGPIRVAHSPRPSGGQQNVVRIQASHGRRHPRGQGAREKPVVFRIRSSLPLEYFLPNPRFKARITVSGASDIRVALPAYHGAGALYLGRAVTLQAAQFMVTEAK